MTSLRRLSVATLVLGFGHVVFGAIVRITGSGMGCGDHWPQCQGHWFPPLDRPDLIIEITHRWFAATLSLAIVVLLVATLRQRRTPGVGGPGGVLRPVALATALVATAAIFGGITVKLALTNPYVTVVHLAIAMTLLATLIGVIVRAAPVGAATTSVTPRTARGATAAAGLTFIALVLGALTAHIPGANAACTGFPLCDVNPAIAGAPVQVQLTHRIVAFLLFFHVLAFAFGVRRRRERPSIVALAIAAATLVVLQLGIAAAMIELALPPVLRSLHEAVGTGIWLATFAAALIAHRARRSAEPARDSRAGERVAVAGARA
jgi:heme a synthase